MKTLCKISDLLGPRRVVWRYDPIIISSISDYAFHRLEFERIARVLSGKTKRVVISIVDFYKKTERRLNSLKEQGCSFDLNPLESGQLPVLLKDMVSIAHYHGLEILSCAEECDYSQLGICPGRCIDGELIDSLWGIQKDWKKDPGQRDACGCIVSRDIGTPNTCLHNCVYCYATVSEKAALSNWQNHHSESPMLVGWPERAQNVPSSPQGSLFK